MRSIIYLSIGYYSSQVLFFKHYFNLNDYPPLPSPQSTTSRLPFIQYGSVLLTNIFDPDIMITDLLVVDIVFTLLAAWDHNDVTRDVTLLSKHYQRLISGSIIFTPQGTI